MQHEFRGILSLLAVVVLVSTLLLSSAPNDASAATIGGIDLGDLTDYMFYFGDARTDANWQGASKGFTGDVAVSASADQRTSGTVPYAGTIYTDDSVQGAWQDIVDDNAGQAFGIVTNETTRLSDLADDINAAFTAINALSATTGYDGVSSGFVDGLDTTNGIAETLVIDITSGLSTGDQIDITGDPGDVYIIRWDSDNDVSNGYDGQVKFNNCGGIVPHGGLSPSNFIHVAGDINSSGGCSNPPSDVVDFYPSGPRIGNGQGDLATGASEFTSGGFFTGYWLTTGKPDNPADSTWDVPYGESSSMSNGIFVGGWYSINTKFSMTSGTSSVYVGPLDYGDLPEPTYLTTRKTTGPSGPAHVVTDKLFIGTNFATDIDTEGDGQPNATATGDDIVNLDDEQGVTFPTFFAGQSADVTVSVTNNTGSTATLYGFIDWNGDGDFNDTGETVTRAVADGTAGNVTLTFNVPAYATTGADLGARFRLSTDSTLGPTDPQGDNGPIPAPDGEVEDYLVQVNKPAAIGNYVWVDENSDGYQDAGEPGIPNVTVVLYDDRGNQVARTVTDTSGGYLFNNLAPGSYYVDVQDGTDNQPNTLPFSGMTQTPPSTLPGADFGNQDHGTTSIPNTSFTGHPVTIGSGEENLTADFGYNYNPADDVNNGTNTGAIGDRIWVDADGDGFQDPEEAGISGVCVELVGPGTDGIFGTADDAVLATTTTNATGNYLFDGLAPSAYVVRVCASNFGTNGALENYTQIGDPDHFGTTGTNNDNQTTSPVVLAPGDVFLNADFGYQPPAAADNTVGDTVWFDADADGTQDAGEPGIPGVSVALIEDTNGNGVWDAGEPIIATDVTDANGNYLFDGLPDGKYIVWVNDTDNVLGELTQTGDPDSTLDNMSAVDLDSGNASSTPVSNLDQDFGYAPLGHDTGEGLIGDTIWFDTNRNGTEDAGEPGIEGVVVELYDSTGTTLLATTTTDENGNYYFGGLDPDATYVVKVAASNFASGGTLEGMSNTGDPEGTPGDNESSSILTAASPIDLTRDFGYAAATQPLGSIGDTVWYDADGDGVQDPEEPGIAGVEVELYDSAGTTLLATATTDENGNYLFTGLPVDADGETYVVTVSASNFNSGEPLNGLTQTFDDDGVGTANTSTTTISTASPAAQVDLDQDFGYRSSTLNTVGDRIWYDLNGNGVQDANEPGLAGVAVTLTDSNGNQFTTMTDGEGYYLFTDLPDGSYTITVDTGTLPGGVSTTPTGDPENNGDNTTAFTLTGGQDDRIRDFGYPPDAGSPLGVIGDTVWSDINNNGAATPDAGEPGLAGVTVNLWQDVNQNGTLEEGTDTLLQSTTTDANGNYLFTGLALDDFGGDSDFDYLVDVDTATLPSYVTKVPSYDPTAPDDSVSSVALSGTNLAGGSHVNVLQDFSYPPQSEDIGRSGNLVWEDLNANGVYEADGPDGIPGTADDESPIGGVTADLYRDVNGNGQVDPGEPLVATTVTASTISGEYGPNGNYVFEGLPAGSYVVDVSDEAGVLTGYWHSLGTSDADNNSQVDPYAVSIGNGEPLHDYSADFGYYVKPAALGNFVWSDTNGNGIQDTGEPGIADVEVKLTITYPDGTVTTIVSITDADGFYSFGNLLLDEDYNGVGTPATEGVGGGDEPYFEISIPTPPGKPSPQNQTDETLDSDDPTGEPASPIQGTVNNTYDFGFLEGGVTAVTLAQFEATVRDGAVVLTWSTSSELDNMGFNLYRGTSPDGPDTRLSEELIPSQSPGTMAGASYEFTDTHVKSGVITVYYWLDDVDFDGVATRHGPLMVRLLVLKN